MTTKAMMKNIDTASTTALKALVALPERAEDARRVLAKLAVQAQRLAKRHPGRVALGALVVGAAAGGALARRR